jgi:sulfur-oxidizing protein SoxZ
VPQTRIVAPAKARKGEVIEIKTLINHVMETGFRRDNVGRAIPRDIITRFTCTYAGEEVFRMDLFTGVAANPFVAFTTIATETETWCSNGPISTGPSRASRFGSP